MIDVRSIILVVIGLWLSGLSQAQIQTIGVVGDGEFTRFTLMSETPYEPELIFMESGDSRYIDLRGGAFSVSPEAFLGEPMGGVRAYEIGTDHIRLELDRPMLVMRQLALPPVGEAKTHRFILDLTQVSEMRFSQRAARDANAFSPAVLASVKPEAGVSSTPERAPAPAAEPERRSMLSSVYKVAHQTRYRIVIDPGHGGHDPGALSIIGGKESDLVLKTALELKRLIEQDSRYYVYLTRDSDVYVEHEDRVSRARNWGADLFISLHADAGGAPSVSGASVYTISTRGEARIEGVSKKFGWELPFEDGTPDDVSDILQDLTLRETKSNSTIFAEILVPELGRAGPLLRNTHRQKNLFVLLAPDVPAVLVEIGFLTNRADAKRLRSEAGRKRMAVAISRAINAYFDQKEILLASN